VARLIVRDSFGSTGPVLTARSSCTAA
jgi:hypothetical protein